MNTIGCRIKELRIAKGLTQSGLGAVLAIGQKSVSSRDILIEIREDSTIYNALINRVTSKRVIMNAVTV